MSISFIVPTCGRPTLARTLESIASQIEDGDEILVLCDTNSTYGNTSRDELMTRAKGTHLLFIDDDDVYAPGAIAKVREAINGWPEHIHIFRMSSVNDNDPWHDRQVRLGNLGTPMVVWPNVPGFPSWAADSGSTSDFKFIEEAIRRFGRDLIWHEEVLAIVRPA